MKEVIKMQNEDKLKELISDYRDYICFDQTCYYVYSNEQFAAMLATLDYILCESQKSQFNDALDFLNHMYEMFSSLIKYGDDMFDIGQNIISELIYNLVEDDSAYNGRMIYG